MVWSSEAWEGGVWAEVAAYLYATTGTEANVVIIVMNGLSVD